MNGLDWLTRLSWQLSWWDALALLQIALVALSLPSVLLERRGRPQSAVAWVLVLTTLPIVGLICWWAIGRRHLQRRRRKKRRATTQLAKHLDTLSVARPPLPTARWTQLDSARLPAEEAEWAYDPVDGNRVELLCNGREAFPAMESLIENASDHIHLLFYIWQPDATGRRFRDLLCERARHGVQVRVLLDAVGSYWALRNFMDPLREAGGKVVAFSRPVFLRWKLELNFRNHRKLILADGREAILGGFNIGDEYHGMWRDTAVHLIGPVVDQLQEIFADDWMFATAGDDFVQPSHFGGWQNSSASAHTESGEAACQLIASGPHTRLNLTLEALLIAVTQAQQRIWLTTPYFVPNQLLLGALRSAVLRGVDVQVLVPARNDSWLVALASRSYYPELLRAGVKIWEYLPTILHAKTAIFDEQVALVGSANLDNRSFRLNFELSSFFRDPQTTQDLATMFVQDLQQSRAVSLDEVDASSSWRRLAEAVAHLMSPLL